MSGAGASGRRGATWLFAAVIFLGGCGVGAGLTYLRIGRVLQERVFSPDDLPERMARRVTRELDLTDKEEKRLVKIFTRRIESLAAAREESMARIEPELDELDAEVAEVLGPEKAEKWDKTLKKKRKRWGPKRRRQ